MQNPDTPSPPPITVVLVEDDRETREAIVGLIGGETGIRCVAAYASAEDAVREVPRLAPAVALVDINLPGMRGPECVAKLKALQPALRVLMITTYEESELIFQSLRAGANGYLLKKMIGTDLRPAIEQVHAGGAPMSMPVARKVVEFFHAAAPAVSDVDKLTAREQEILALLAKGCLYKQIGDQLGISFSTVRAHLRNIYEKLHVQSRTEATVKFLQRR